MEINLNSLMCFMPMAMIATFIGVLTFGTYRLEKQPQWLTRGKMLRVVGASMLSSFAVFVASIGVFFFVALISIGAD